MPLQPTAPSRFLHGGDYNPEQWPETVWAEDVRLMREAGITAATVGVFAWSALEPAEGVYAFSWLDRVVALLHENGIGEENLGRMAQRAVAMGGGKLGNYYPIHEEDAQAIYRLAL